MRFMSAIAIVEKARRELAAGEYSTARRTAWDAVNRAMLESDDRAVRELQEVSAALVAVSKGRDREDAEILDRYCRAVIEGVGGGVESPGVLDRIFSFGRKPRQGDRTRCPDCAEDIHVEAKVCRHCGYRLDQSAEPGAPTS